MPGISMIGASLIFSPIVKEKKVAGFKERERVGTVGTGLEQGWNTEVFRLTSP
jgi:hypothetical protein